eukprot:3746591-Rhodomonas_salina.3
MPTRPASLFDLLASGVRVESSWLGGWLCEPFGCLPVGVLAGFRVQVQGDLAAHGCAAGCAAGEVTEGGVRAGRAHGWRRRGGCQRWPGPRTALPGRVPRDLYSSSGATSSTRTSISLRAYGEFGTDTGSMCFVPTRSLQHVRYSRRVWCYQEDTDITEDGSYSSQVGCPTPRNPIQETANSVQLVPGKKLLVFDFEVRLSYCHSTEHTPLATHTSMPGTDIAIFLRPCHAIPSADTTSLVPGTGLVHALYRPTRGLRDVRGVHAWVRCQCSACLRSLPLSSYALATPCPVLAYCMVPPTHCPVLILCTCSCSCWGLSASDMATATAAPRYEVCGTEIAYATFLLRHVMLSAYAPLWHVRY